MNTPDEAMKSCAPLGLASARWIVPADASIPDPIKELDDMALDRLKSAGSPFELEKAQAIAAYVQWRIERADRGL